MGDKALSDAELEKVNGGDENGINWKCFGECIAAGVLLWIVGIAVLIHLWRISKEELLRKN